MSLAATIILMVVVATLIMWSTLKEKHKITSYEQGRLILVGLQEVYTSDEPSTD